MAKRIRKATVYNQEAAIRQAAKAKRKEAEPKHLDCNTEEFLIHATRIALREDSPATYLAALCRYIATPIKYEEVMRAKGYYWVRYDGQLTVAYWGGDYVCRDWSLPASDYIFHDEDFSWISSAPIPEPYIPVPNDGPKQVYGEDLLD